MISARVAVATHLLAYLTWRRDRPVPSSELASSVNTNPVVVRRLIGALRDAGLVRVRHGTEGGAELARPAESISLYDVYRAVQPGEDLFALHPHGPCGTCPVGRGIVDVLEPVFDRAETALEQVLAGVSVRDVYAGLKKPTEMECGDRPRKRAVAGERR